MEQQLCLNCNTPIEGKEGKRAKKYCNDACRASHWSKLNKKGQKWVKREVYEEIVKERDEALAKLHSFTTVSIKKGFDDPAHGFSTDDYKSKLEAIVKKSMAEWVMLLPEESKKPPVPPDPISFDTKQFSNPFNLPYYNGGKEEAIESAAKEKKPPVIKDKGAKKGSKKEYPASVAKILDDMPAENIPLREKGESGIAYSIRLAEWKEKLKVK